MRGKRVKSVVEGVLSVESVEGGFVIPTKEESHKVR